MSLLVKDISEDNTHSTSEMESLLKECPPSTNILVVDTDFSTLLDMRKIMRQYNYGVKIETDGKRALAFLRNCEHEINIVIWDFHMPRINGIQALKVIGSKMDLPVIIMSDHNQSESVMEATIHGACDYVKKPVREDVIANIWQHIVRKRMKSNQVSIPVLDLAQSGRLDHKVKETSVKRTRTTWTGDVQPFEPDLVQIDDLYQQNEYYITINQDVMEENAAKKQRMTWTEENQLVQTDLVHTEGLDQDDDDLRFLFEEYIEKNIVFKPQKSRLSWAGDRHERFLEAIERVGGLQKATPKLILKCMQEDMKMEGLSRNKVSNHLQRYRMGLEYQNANQQTQGIGCSSSVQGSSNVHTASSSYFRNDQAMNTIKQNQNGYLTMNNNEFITKPDPPRFHYFDNLHEHKPQQNQSSKYQASYQEQQCHSSYQEQQYQLPNLPASDISATDPELTFPSLPYDPNELFFNG